MCGREDTVSQASSVVRVMKMIWICMRTMRVEHAVIVGDALVNELEEESSLSAARSCGTGRERDNVRSLRKN